MHCKKPASSSLPLEATRPFASPSIFTLRRYRRPKPLRRTQRQQVIRLLTPLILPLTHIRIIVQSGLGLGWDSVWESPRLFWRRFYGSITVNGFARGYSKRRKSYADCRRQRIISVCNPKNRRPSMRLWRWRQGGTWLPKNMDSQCQNYTRQRHSPAMEFYADIWHNYFKGPRGVFPNNPAMIPDSYVLDNIFI